MVENNDTEASYTVPGVTLSAGQKAGNILQLRLHSLNDLQLTLKHVHWNVVGRDFIGVYEMLDPQIDEVRLMVDALAERMATLGVSPNGLPGDLVARRTWDDYSINRAATAEHLAALDLVYSGVVTSMRSAMAEIGALDPITEDLLMGQIAALEQFQWFIRAHLESDAGTLANAGEHTEVGAAQKLR
ncbi:Dps family protein [Paeniglutamicibacter cryotolerans]|uniref:Starvation-inducible DNA-binding protein n=1 Tax=Paeniglutamicibacter cryotolerans TaxID=670079 RepID=A0A839QJM0_9MICC|nr:DNA starvation/stationary phase protection protein [Paeniglutamicibacter cryotolerans]MBB2995793.1 starvation-inducible DNA-binding protein [Paeniglutamicibacter cryotolerans]